jgi:hypothetical protein
MARKITRKSTSTELTGGAGFTFEDRVVAYYLAALLREEHAAGQSGIVISVAVQQGKDHPMDDIVVEFREHAARRLLGLQVKRQLRISAARSNSDFREIMAAAVATRRTPEFQESKNAYGFAVEHVAVAPMRSFNRLIEWAKSSPSGKDFRRRFAKAGSAANAERNLRKALLPLIGARSADEELSFYTHFVALQLDGLGEGGFLRSELFNRLQELVASNEDGQNILLFDRLCRIARDAAGTARKWTRPSLLAELRGVVRLKVIPNYRADIDLLQSFSTAGMDDVAEQVAGFRVERPTFERSVRDRLAECRLVNLSGLPGGGKSAMLKRIATEEAARGPILFLKSDRLAGNSWLTFAAAIGLRHRVIADLLAEIGSTGTPILFIDGIDRVRPDQKAIITDILRAIEGNDHLAHWRVLASSRDQGLEAYRAWFPASFYRGTGIGDVSIGAFSDVEAEALANEQPNLRRLLFGPAGVREIARRPFFAAVLARSFPDNTATPQTEVDLISAWWARAGHDASAETVPQRQRALLDLAEKGVRNLGKNIRSMTLKDSTFEQVAALKVDLIIRDHDGGASYSFTHDIFFEWVFFRRLIELGDDWKHGLTEAGEPPLLGRVIGLLAQSTLVTPAKWSAEYRDLECKPLRPQWRREWLTAPPFTVTFAEAHQEFQDLLAQNDYALLEKLLVWFQAQHTIPSPVVLQNAPKELAGIDRVRMADLLSWPSDFDSWGRFLDWLIGLAPSLPVRLMPSTLQVFEVWQNALADLKNPRSAAIIGICADWLMQLEGVEYPAELRLERGRWHALGREAKSHLAAALRSIILRSARAYPSPARALFERAVANKHMRSDAYKDLMAFTPIMADVCPELVAAVAKAELMKELPQDRLDREWRERREQAKYLASLRAIPEEDRTDDQRRALEHTYFPIGYDRIDLDDVGIDAHHNYYFPPSALHEPFATLFVRKPEAALELVRELANHATKGWRQVHLINRERMSTPIPLVLEFPWGKQEFWGDWHVYSWFMGELAPQPLECAFLALSYWAFKQIEAGRPTDEVVRKVVEGSDCYATLGLALVLALETYDVSDTTFPLVTCQRLWHHDMARLVHEPTRNLDLFGVGFLSRLTGDRATAKAFLDSRQGRKREVRELAMRFALSTNDHLRTRFKNALACFPNDLPYEFEEQRSNEGYKTHLQEDADRWAGLGDIRNYRRHETKEKDVLISYQPPVPMTPAQKKILQRSTTSLQEHSVIAWATKSLQANALADGHTLADAIAFARARDKGTILAERKEAGAHSAQTTISAVAAVVIRFGPPGGKDYGWAWRVMERIAAMAEPRDSFHASRIPWHPANHLIVTLVHDRRGSSPRADSVRRLFDLTAHPNIEVAQFAFQGLFLDSDEHVRWVAAQLAMDLSLYYRFKIKSNGQRDNTANLNARKESLARALARLDDQADTPLTILPPAWVNISNTPTAGLAEDDTGWRDPDPSFDAQFAAKLFPLFPIEAWCRSSPYRPMVLAFLKDWVSWAAQRLMPSWLVGTHRRRSDRGGRSLFEWNRVLGDLLARAAPYFDTEQVRKELLAPFLTNDEEGLGVLAPFADMTVRRQVLDTPIMPANTLDLLHLCVERVVQDRVFNKSYRAGEVLGHDLPALIRALLFVPNEQVAPGSARFANGDWSQIDLAMPIVTRLVSATGWSASVMATFLTLCERAGVRYPLDPFAAQANAVLGSIANAKGSWAGTMLPARLAATVQRIADANFPLRADQAQSLLKVLDALIDLGDRRSAALEQTEAFREVQGASPGIISVRRA